MHLNGQVILCVDEFNQNREIAEPSAMAPQHFLALRVNVLLQVFPRERAVHNRGRAIRVAGQLPAFGEHVAVVLLAVLLRQTVATPNIILTTRF